MMQCHIRAALKLEVSVSRIERLAEKVELTALTYCQSSSFRVDP
jgi:hypothetical protein